MRFFPENHFLSVKPTDKESIRKLCYENARWADQDNRYLLETKYRLPIHDDSYGTYGIKRWQRWKYDDYADDVECETNILEYSVASFAFDMKAAAELIAQKFTKISGERHYPMDELSDSVSFTLKHPGVDDFDPKTDLLADGQRIPLGNYPKASIGEVTIFVLLKRKDGTFLCFPPTGIEPNKN